MTTWLARLKVFSALTAIVSLSAVETKPPDVLIIYDSGLPSKTISELKGEEEFSIVATATPQVTNCRTVARDLGGALKAKGLTVRIVEAGELKDYKQILQSPLVVLGTPTRFWNVSWPVKKLLEEQFGRIYVSAKGQFAKQKVAAYAMAEIEPSATAALQALKLAVRDCGAELSPTMIVLTNQSEGEVLRRIIEFGDQLASVLERN